MKVLGFSGFYTISTIYWLAFWVVTPGSLVAEPAPAADAMFNSYTAAVEVRIGRQHHSLDGFLAPVSSGSQGEARLRNGELVVERLTPSTGADLSGALLHHWRGSAFVPGAKVDDFEGLLGNFSAYPQRFSPQVLQAKVLARNGDRLQAVMRVRQRHVITVVLDATYNVEFGQLDFLHGFSTSRSTRIREIGSPGTTSEHALNLDEEHGFLWRLNTYWSYEERDGGLYLQIESISLTRSIPRGLGWAIRPLAESIPRESLEFTLRSACNALRK